jgi:hypothetical protein
MTVRNYVAYNDMRFVRFPISFGTDPDNALMLRLLVYMFKRDGDFIICIKGNTCNGILFKVLNLTCTALQLIPQGMVARAPLSSFVLDL